MDTRVKERIDDFTGERTELEIWSSRETGRVRSDSGKRDVQRRFRVGEILRGSTSRQPTINLNLAFQTSVVLDLVADQAVISAHRSPT